MPQFTVRRALDALLWFITCATAMAAPAEFAQFPAESAFRTPAPNVIVSVDNSPSMDTPDVRASDVGLSTSDNTITRMQALKQVLRELFSPANLPDDTIRLAYQASHGCNLLPSIASISSPECAVGKQIRSNRMARLRGTGGAEDRSTRGAFFQWLDLLATGNGIAAADLVDNAGGYLMLTDADNPWNDVPGVAQTGGSAKACRRSWHLLLTDGSFTPPQPDAVRTPEQGIAAIQLPDGVTFDPASNPQLQIYAGSPRALRSPSSIALRYWANDLQPALDNRVSPDYPQLDDEVFVTTSGKLTLGAYWNPKNDPATWQHMVNFTMDFGGGGAPVAAPPVFFSQRGTFGGTDYQQLLSGAEHWPEPFSSVDAMRQDLWHAALNSRGRHFQIGGSLDALKQTLGNILSRIAVTGGPVISGYASNGNSTMYVASYEAGSWSGQILSSQFPAPGESAATPNADWGTLSSRPLQPQRGTADRLDARTDIDRRLILTHNGVSGVPFRWSSLHTDQQTLLQSHGLTSSFGADLVSYLRGERRLESTSSGSGFRVRTSRQADIVHSQIWYVGKPASGYSDKSYRDFAARNASRSAMLYVGGNDGMLHGFSAKDGEELIAYVPRGLYRHLHLLADPGYRHHYYVDGSPFTGDAQIGTATAVQWKTLLVGTLGAGGPGFFILDVTAPDNVDKALDAGFDESNAAALVMMDRTDGSDPDIGYIFAAPITDEANPQRTRQITRTNNQRWAVILGNGYGSANGKPVLLIQYLDGARELLKIPASHAPLSLSTQVANGLSAPQLLDVNGDGVPDVVYAGDLQGHLWKFDIAAASDQRWSVALAGVPLFTAQRSHKAQPITAAPVLRVHPDVGGLLIAFGTGQELTEADSADASVQSVYVVMDYTRYLIQDSGADAGKIAVDTTRTGLPAAAASRDELMDQSAHGDAIAGQGRNAGKTFWELKGAPFAYCMKTVCAENEKKGWYLDLPAERERVLQPLVFYGSGNVLEIISRSTPSATPGSSDAPLEACEQEPRSAQSFRTLVNIASGTAPKTHTMDTNGDGHFTAQDGLASRATTAGQELRLQSGTVLTRQGSDGKTDRLNAPPTRVLHPSWRHLK